MAQGCRTGQLYPPSLGLRICPLSLHKPSPLSYSPCVAFQFPCLNILPGHSNSDVPKSSLSSKNTVRTPAERYRPGPSLPLSVLLLSDRSYLRTNVICVLSFSQIQHVNCINSKSYIAQKSVSINSGPDSIVMHSFIGRYCFCQSSKMMMNISLFNSIWHAKAICSREIHWS